MTDRFVAWLSTGVLAVAVSMAAITGAAGAAADEGADTSTSTSPSTSPSTSSSSTSPSRSTPGKQRSGTDAQHADAPQQGAGGSAAHDGTEDQDDRGTTDRPEVTEDPGPSTDDTATAQPEPQAQPQPEPQAEPEAEAEAEETVGDIAAPTEHAKVRTAPSPTQPAPAVTGVADSDQPSSTAVHLSPAQDAADLADRAPLPSLLNVIGSFFWGLFDLATKLVDFPPAVPPGSTLTAGRSKLEIDCGDRYTADADWYFPTKGEPEKFIYFQHGFPARAGFYNVTLQQLAERNNAIVVAPSITSNIFACDACAASGEPMHAAVARLFEGDRGPADQRRGSRVHRKAARAVRVRRTVGRSVAGDRGGGLLLRVRPATPRNPTWRACCCMRCPPSAARRTGTR